MSRAWPAPNTSNLQFTRKTAELYRFMRRSPGRYIVTKYVGRDAFLVEAGMRSSSGRCMLFEQIGEAPSAKWLSPGIDEHLGRSDPPAHGKPGAQGCGRAFPQGERPFPPSLAKNANTHRQRIDVLELQPRQLGHA